MPTKFKDLSVGQRFRFEDSLMVSSPFRKVSDTDFERLDNFVVQTDETTFVTARAGERNRCCDPDATVTPLPEVDA